MAGELILIVDDEKAIRTALSGILEDEGYRVASAGAGTEALARVADELPELVILDIWMPDLDGLETLAELKRLHPDLAVVMISGHGTIETAVKATKLGAYDFIEKPLSLEKTLLVVARALEHARLERENRALRQRIEQGYELVGDSPGIRELRRQIAVAAPTNGRVLVYGENGVGKELVARAIHARSARRERPFVEVNCAAIPEELIESELFGHEKGAFTGAIARRRGKFELADGGTLFLDEVGDMSLKTQAKVLRVLEEQAFERVGGKETIRVDVRVIAASNQNLADLIAQGRFREDLFYRLNVIPIEVPPLRRHKEDIPRLVEHFLRVFSTEYGRRPKVVTGEAMAYFMTYAWPGNVRE
ncbi:MAG: sigma-54-dependent Fis family transcriptional regulator, partial [Candidatus Rokubacteria bacterium]|nr:sigma-54-dependent Fis family transcriptional regulator [Candidatus Rokubacteria bacterium]